jgi:hypothetical protein
MKGGLSSGEGLMNKVRDEQKEWNLKERRDGIVCEQGTPQVAKAN